ncbi:MAG TPA: diacylglycerol kinase [Bauldia sp.]|nr:diacylglycerol kinase [Bauldia sp.]
MLRAFSHIVHAGRNSLAGFHHLLHTELAARIEIAASALAFLWLLVLGRGIGDFVILLVLFCILMSVEALNTAIERIVDRESPEVSEFARVTKDLGSTAVFFVLAAAGVYLVAVSADSAGLIVL